MKSLHCQSYIIPVRKRVHELREEPCWEGSLRGAAAASADYHRAPSAEGSGADQPPSFHSKSSLKEPAPGSCEAEEQNRPGLECCFEIYTSFTQGSPTAGTLGIRNCSQLLSC